MSGIKLYSMSDSPPTRSVRMCLKHLGVEFELVNVDLATGENHTDEYKKKNPQGEVPALDDHGFLLSESCAILQYLGDAFKKDDTFYPSDPKQRAVVNHRLAFHMTTYYKAVLDHMMGPLFWGYKRTKDTEKKMRHAVGVLEVILTNGGPYVAGKHLTIADLALIMATVCLEAMGFDLGSYPKVKGWYEGFKGKFPALWEIAKGSLEELIEFEKNPPDLSYLKHPLHPMTKGKIETD